MKRTILKKITSLAGKKPISEGKKIVKKVREQIDYDNMKGHYDKAVKKVAEKPAMAAKAFIVDDHDKILIIKRADDDVQKPGIWEIPGGRLQQGENPIKGLVREVKEEAGLNIEVKNILEVHKFTRDDSQKICMSVYLCKPLNFDIKLSPEHTEFEWIHITKAKNKLTKFFHKEVDKYQKKEYEFILKGC